VSVQSQWFGGNLPSEVRLQVSQNDRALSLDETMPRGDVSEIDQPKMPLRGSVLTQTPPQAHRHAE